jgi:hypothetical protein
MQRALQRGASATILPGIHTIVEQSTKQIQHEVDRQDLCEQVLRQSMENKGSSRGSSQSQRKQDAGGGRGGSHIAENRDSSSSHGRGESGRVSVAALSSKRHHRAGEVSSASQLELWDAHSRYTAHNGMALVHIEGSMLVMLQVQTHAVDRRASNSKGKATHRVRSSSR